MKRLHVHIAVDSLTDSIHFYSSMFAAEPTVRQDDYAKWMLDDPRVNFAISQRGAPAGLNHLGIEVESDAELGEMQARLRSLAPDIEKEANVACCYAKSDKYWVTDPQGLAWETFHTLADSPIFGTSAPTSECCIPLAKAMQASEAPCCVPSSGRAASGGACC